MSGQPVRTSQRGSSGAAILGAVLVVLGLIFLADEYLNLNFGEALWPLYVIAPGVALVALGLTQRHGSGLTILGSMIGIVGLLLLYQNATDNWESWAYAWALVAPGGSGLGMLLYGVRAGNPGMTRGGLWQIVTGLALFAAGIVFFEGILNISGDKFPLPSWGLPLVVILLGLLLLFRGMSARPDAHVGEVEPPVTPPPTAPPPPSSTDGSPAPAPDPNEAQDDAPGRSAERDAG